MKMLALTILGCALATPILSKAATASDNPPASLRAVAPALVGYAEGPVRELWARPELSRRDRSIVTLSVLIARSQPTDLPSHLALALENGVKPAEISELITHLAFYAGWSNASMAAVAARDVFAARGVDAGQLPPAAPNLLPIDAAAEADRAARVQQSVESTSPGLVKFTGEVLFQNLWLRPNLAPRDRSLVTVSSLIALGQVAQMSFHLNRAMDNGLTRVQAGEVIAHIAFYAGWPNAFSAVPVAREVFERRKG